MKKAPPRIVHARMPLYKQVAGVRQEIGESVISIDLKNVAVMRRDEIEEHMIRVYLKGDDSPWALQDPNHRFEQAWEDYLTWQDAPFASN